MSRVRKLWNGKPPPHELIDANGEWEHLPSIICLDLFEGLGLILQSRIKMISSTFKRFDLI